MEPQTSLHPYIDSSQLACFRACPRKYYWEYVRNLAPSGESIHLLAGGAFAAGIEAARRLQFSAAEPRPTEELQAAATRAFLTKWGDYEAPEDSAKSWVNTHDALMRYIEEHHPAHDPVRPFNKDSTEFSFAIPLDPHVLHPVTNEPFIFAGRFDLLGLYNDLPVILDEKTTSALGSYWLQSWDLRGQFLGYCWACQKLGYKVNVAIIRGIAILKTQTQFQTVPVGYSQHLIDRWEVELYRTLQRIVWCYTNDQWDYNFADACTSYGGCQYKTLCMACDPEAFMNNYQERTWSPISHP